MSKFKSKIVRLWDTTDKVGAFTTEEYENGTLIPLVAGCAGKVGEEYNISIYNVLSDVEAIEFWSDVDSGKIKPVGGENV